MIEAGTLTFFYHALVDWIEETYDVKITSNRDPMKSVQAEDFERIGFVEAIADIHEMMLDADRKRIQRDHAYRLADQVLEACNGDYRKAITELRGGLDCRDNAPNEIHLQALGLLRKWKRKIGRDSEPV